MLQHDFRLISKDVDPSDEAVTALMDEAISAIPRGYVKNDSEGNLIPENLVAMLPRSKVKGTCRLCGKTLELTKEHIPPKSSGNKNRHDVYSFDDWLSHSETQSDQQKIIIEQGGIFGFTLCKPCNDQTGEWYGNEYKHWAEIASCILSDLGQNKLEELNRSAELTGLEIKLGTKEHPVKPGALVRQVLSCMCSLSGAWNLPEHHPEIRRIVLEKSQESLPSGLELGVSLYVGPSIRILGPQLKLDTKTMTWRWCQEIAFPPLAFLFVIASNNPEPGLGLQIGNWTESSPEDEYTFEGVFDIGFGWTPFPGDYRSQAAIKVERNTNASNT